MVRLLGLKSERRLLCPVRRLNPHLRLLKGNPGKRPARKPPEPARTEQCLEPPEHLTGYAREAWLRLAPELHRLNLLTVLDVGPFSA